MLNSMSWKPSRAMAIAGAKSSGSFFLPWTLFSSHQPARLPGAPTARAPRCNCERLLSLSTGKFFEIGPTKSSVRTRFSLAM